MYCFQVVHCNFIGNFKISDDFFSSMSNKNPKCPNCDERVTIKRVGILRKKIIVCPKCNSTWNSFNEIIPSNRIKCDFIMNNKVILLLILIKLFSIIVPVSANESITSSYLQTDPTIDGVINNGEWDDATFVDISNLIGGTAKAAAWVDLENFISHAYIKNDEKYLFIALDLITSDQVEVEFESAMIILDGDNSEKWPTSPANIVTYHFSPTTSILYTSRYYIPEDHEGKGIPASEFRSSAFVKHSDAQGHDQYEFKIPIHDFRTEIQYSNPLGIYIEASAGFFNHTGQFGVAEYPDFNNIEYMINEGPIIFGDLYLVDNSSLVESVLSGVISDVNSGEIIKDVEVNINGISYYSDSDGRYNISLHKGHYGIQVNKEGYETWSQTIEISDEQYILDIQLTKSDESARVYGEPHTLYSLKRLSNQSETYRSIIVGDGYVAWMIEDLNEIYFTDESYVITINEDEKYSFNPDINEERIFWHALGDWEGSELIMFDIEEGETYRLTNNSYDELDLSCDGDLITYTLAMEESNSEIYLQRISNSEVTRLTNNNYPDNGPHISGDIVTWTGYFSEHESSGEVYYCIISSGSIIQLTDDNIEDKVLDVEDEKILFIKRDVVETLYLYDIRLGKSYNISDINSRPNELPEISDGFVTWSGSNPAYPNLDSEIYLYNIESGKKQVVTVNEVEDIHPSFSSGVLVWQDYTENDFEIYRYSPESGRVVRLTFNNVSDYNPMTSDGLIVWVTSDGLYEEIVAVDIVRSESEIVETIETPTIEESDENMDAEADVLWSKNFGGKDYDYCNDVKQTVDGGFILIGESKSFSITDDSVIYLVKTDSEGNQQWNKKIKYSALSSDSGNSVQQTFDEGYIIGGSTEVFTSTGAASATIGTYIFVVKTDSEGEILWKKKFGSGGGDDFASCIQQTSDEGYVLVGSCLMKIDSNGDKIWEKDIEGQYVIETKDRGFIIVGPGMYSHSSLDLSLIKTDSEGNVNWIKTFGGSGQEAGLSVQQTFDSGFIISGGSTSFTDDYESRARGHFFEMYLIKTDVNGSEQWQKNFPDAEAGNSVLQTFDGGFFVVGGTYIGEKNGVFDWDMYIIKLDENGNELWSDSIGGLGFETCTSALQTSTGDFILAGDTSSFSAGLGDFYLLKVKESNARAPTPTPERSQKIPGFSILGILFGVMFLSIHERSISGRNKGKNTQNYYAQAD